ncbi:MAG: glycosyltransferase [Actinomycetota bacterium]
MRLDVVIPAHNEEKRIGRTLRAYRARCTSPDTRFIVALDRCTDRTIDVVRRHMSADHRVGLLQFPKLGKGGVLMEAFRVCEADLIGFVDADCATPPAEFLRLVEAAETADGAIATRYHPAAVLPNRRSMSRRLTSVGFSLVVRNLFGLPYTDTQCGAKVLSYDLVRRITPLLSSRDFLFDVDVLVTARRLGFTIVEVPTIWIDRDGSHVNAAADAKKMAVSALRLWLHHKTIPLPDDDTIETSERVPTLVPSRAAS